MDIKEELLNVCKTVYFDEPMKKHTTFKIGGPADIFCEPGDIEEIKNVLYVLKKYKIDFFIMGNGSNLLVADKGIRGAVIKIGDKMNDIKVCGNRIYVQSGALLSKTANAALKNKLTGMECISGIPGSIGGAIYMNAGAYGAEISQIVNSVTYITPEGEIKTVLGKDMAFGYRKSFFTGSDNVIVYCELQLEEGNGEEISAKMKDVSAKRVSKQPLSMPSAGSVFKRPEGYFAGKLIEDCGLKGFSSGGAEISNLHAGFIVNKGDATAQDVLNVIKHVQSEVYNKFGVMLETEIKILGEL